MRNTFVRVLQEQARVDPTLTLIVGDLGFGVVDDFQRELPDQFLNAGVAEQAMTGVAAGMASAGRRVFTYSIANFPTMRCMEQIRLDVCYHQRDVTVISVGAGVSYGTLGYTHHALEDISMMRALPHMKVVSPADPAEAEAIARYATAHGGPLYVRLGKSGEPILHPEHISECPPGRAIVVREGDDVTLMSTGVVLAAALAAADQLAKSGVSVRVISSPWIKPLDEETILRAASETAGIVTIEDHTLQGGFGSAVLELLSDKDITKPVRRVGFPDSPSKLVGSSSYLMAAAGVDPEAVMAAARGLLRLPH